jgi:MYXO-CTERM domain-containing protein
MKFALTPCSLLVVTLATLPTSAATLYVSPTGTLTTGCTTRAIPCSLSAAASSAVAGDTVVLMDGLYQEPLYVTNSGAASAFITFQADECATPIIEGPGAGPDDAMDQSGGVHSTTAEYIRFIGIVARGWNIGFGNGWAGGVESTDVSNGHWEIEYCISYSNGRTGFTFFSASDFHLKNSISAHNGSSRTHAWSSGVTLFEATGTNLIEGNISFENTDAERSTDGSGFVVDEASNNALFVNNIAFGNSGSCLRLTDSSGTRFINNTCYRNSQFGSAATGPSNPSEIYFTNAGVTVQGVTFMNNVIVGTGQAPAGSMPVVNQPTSGWTNNVVTTGMPSFFTAPTGANPSFVPASGDMQLTGRGSSGNGVPTTDIGFDPKCLVKRTPVMVGQVARVSTWQYDIDIDYIKSIGGVAKCFNPTTRSGAPDVGAYRAGPVTTVMPGSCVPPTIPDPPMGGMGGMAGMAGAGGMAGVAGAGGMGGIAGAGAGGIFGGMGGATVAGAMNAGGSAGVSESGAGGAAGSLGGAQAGGTSSSGTPGAGESGLPAAGSAGGPSSSGAPSSEPASKEPAGCGCRVPRSIDSSRVFTALALLMVGALVIRRRAS